MRINQFIASAAGLSRRAADEAIKANRVSVNNQPTKLGDVVHENDTVRLDGHLLKVNPTKITIMLNKPLGYVCSRRGQGNKTVYELLPPAYQQLKIVGRLDKATTGLVLLTNDGQLANRLSHPRYAKIKIYRVTLDNELTVKDQQKIVSGVLLEDGPSQLILKPLDDSRLKWQVKMSEGRNRQIRRTFSALDYRVESLQRLKFGPYALEHLPLGEYRIV